MFTKILFSGLSFSFMEGKFAPVPRRVIQHRNTGANDRSLLALGLVLCAHLAVFAALRRPLPPLPVVTPPQIMEVNLVSAPQLKQQQPNPPAQPEQKRQKPIKKPVKPTVVVKKTPVRKPAGKPVARVMRQPRHAITTPVEPIGAPVSAASAPIAPVAASTPSKPIAIKEQPFQAPSFNATYLDNPAPAYPAIARRLGEEGRVLLRVQVTVDGAADSVELHKSSGSDLLDEAALAAVKKWRFMPAKRGEQAVKASVIVPVSFSIVRTGKNRSIKDISFNTH